MIAFERRAAAVLFHVLRAHGDPRPFLLPANVCPVVPRTFQAAAQAYELVDIAEPWLEIDGRRCLELVRTNAFAGVLFVRPYGSDRDPSAFFSALREARHDVLIIDDKCLCPPDCDGSSTSSFANVTLYSTGPAKYADLGGGGFGHLRDGVAYQRMTDGPDWLDLRRPEVTWAEQRSRTIAATRMAAAHKSTLNAIYSSAIPVSVQLPPGLQHWRFNIRVPYSARLVAELFARGLFASRHYPSLGSDFPVAARLHDAIVNLFNDRYFTEDQARLATEIVVRHIDSSGSSYDAPATRE